MGGSFGTEELCFLPAISVRRTCEEGPRIVTPGNCGYQETEIAGGGKSQVV